jgi:hypothetical protein
MSESLNIEGKVLFAAYNKDWADIFRRYADESGIIDAEIFVSPDEIVARLHELGEAPKAVFSDGFSGDWREVVAATQEAGTPTFVISGSDRAEAPGEIEAAGATLIPKDRTFDISVIGVTLAQLESTEVG